MPEHARHQEKAGNDDVFGCFRPGVRVTAGEPERGGRPRLDCGLDPARESTGAVEVSERTPVGIRVGPDAACRIERRERRHLVVERRRRHQQAAPEQVLIDAGVDGPVAVRLEARIPVRREADAARDWIGVESPAEPFVHRRRAKRVAAMNPQLGVGRRHEICRRHVAGQRAWGRHDCNAVVGARRPHRDQPRVREAEALRPARHRQLQPAVHQGKLRGRECGVRILPDLRLGLGAAWSRQIVVLAIVKTLALEFVSGRQVHPRPRREECPHVGGVDLADDVREALGGRLESATQRAVGKDAPRVHMLVTGLPAHGLPRAVTKAQRVRVERRRPQAVGIVAAWNICGRADLKRQPAIVQRNLLRRHRHRVDDNRLRDVGRRNAARGGTRVGLYPIVRAKHPHHEIGRLCDVDVHQPVRASAPRRVVPIESVEQVELQRAGRVPQTIVQGAAADRSPGANVAEGAPLDLPFAAEGASARARHDVHDTAHGVGAVQRRPRAAHYLHALRRHEIEGGEKRRRVGLDGRCITEAHAVHEDGRGVGAQTADPHGGELTGPAAVSHLHAGGEPHDLAERVLVARLDVLGLDNRDGLGRFLCDLRKSGCGHDNGIVNPSDLQLDVERDTRTRRHRHHLGAPAEARLPDLHDTHTGRHVVDAVRAGAVGDRGARDGCVLSSESHIGARHSRALRVGDPAGQRRALRETWRHNTESKQTHEDQHGTSHQCTP